MSLRARLLRFCSNTSTSPHLRISTSTIDLLADDWIRKLLFAQLTAVANISRLKPRDTPAQLVTMVGLLTARYNEGMTLGQGFNSFLQESRANKAISFSGTVSAPVGQDRPEDVSQVVTYSSRFVDKLSDVARSMDTSAAACIRNGSIEGFDNLLGVDETKFAMSDFNVLVSVKVVNRECPGCWAARC